MEDQIEKQNSIERVPAKHRIYILVISLIVSLFTAYRGIRLFVNLLMYFYGYYLITIYDVYFLLSTVFLLAVCVLNIIIFVTIIWVNRKNSFQRKKSLKIVSVLSIVSFSFIATYVVAFSINGLMFSFYWYILRWFVREIFDWHANFIMIGIYIPLIIITSKLKRLTEGVTMSGGEKEN